ncbi:MAG: hypothetical protein GDA39_05450 [Hyphomonadaceae bacterium]|nr:hypothetical protein [Hyphomonadaceae bacterium]MBC6412354.1 hypothetical protein [Hyphomonadaceae bacterium]
MAPGNSRFHRLRGWHIPVLLAVTLAYSYWYTALGPYAKLSTLGPGLPLEGRGFYTGAQAVEALSQLEESDRRTKYVALILDVPFMILMALLCKALIAFGIRHMNLVRPIWNFLFILPATCLLADFTEDSLIALTLATKSELTGTLAGLATALKFTAYTPTIIVSLLMTVAGLCVWTIRKLHSDHKSPP